MSIFNSVLPTLRSLPRSGCGIASGSNLRNASSFAGLSNLIKRVSGRAEEKVEASEGLFEELAESQKLIPTQIEKRVATFVRARSP